MVWPQSTSRESWHEHIYQLTVDVFTLFLWRLLKVISLFTSPYRGNAFLHQGSSRLINHLVQAAGSTAGIVV